MKVNLPAVSVVMPVYNAAAFLVESVESILAQTLNDFEFIVIDDGSSDASLDILKEYEKADHRIRLLHQKNSGVVATLNHGIRLATGRYIARMDADDISLPERLALQVELMDDDPRIGVSGGWVQLFGAKNEVWHHRREDNFIRNMLLFKTSGFSHSTVIARRELLQAYPYDHIYPHVEDTGCWVRIALQANCRFANLPQVLVKYRVHQGQVSEIYRKCQLQSYQTIIRDYIVGLGGKINDEELRLHMSLCEQSKGWTAANLDAAGSWLTKLTKMIQHRLPDHHDCFQEKWLNLCLSNRNFDEIEQVYAAYRFTESDHCLIKERLFLQAAEAGE
ncbi:MAG: glycosyltransferase family 2 protein [Hahellaceae bacterium]|nr:glycosyltransferase family 2 protein [Hahellaceae bacterium]MCP5211748.1 glycosyltransferase family 2 protein [Hahellaceae bacterium]